MSCNIRIPLQQIIDDVSAALSDGFIKTDNAVLNEAVLNEVTIRGDISVDTAARNALCAILQTCGITAIELEWLDRPTVADMVAVSSLVGGEIVVTWQDLDALIAAGIVGKVSASDVSVAGGGSQEDKNTEFRNELDALPFEGGILADTFVTVTANGVGSVPRNLRSVISDTINVKNHGAKVDGITDDYTAFIDAIAEASSRGGGVVTVPDGKYAVGTQIIVPSNVTVSGAGSASVEVIAIGALATSSGSIFTTPNITENPLVLSNDLNIGAAKNIINNSCATGDFIRYWSNEQFTKRWDTRQIRAYYNEAELMKVHSATASEVVFTEPPIIDCLTTEMPNVVTFTPSRNISITGMTLSKSDTITSYLSGITFRKVDGGYYDDIVTNNFDNAGILIEKSMGIIGGKTTHNHTTTVNNLGNLYGVMYSDGTRNCYQESITGYGMAHTVTGGGSGWAIPMYNTVNHVHATNSFDSGVETHGNTAYFTYKSANVDKMGRMSGLGHKMLNVVATGSGELTDVAFGLLDGGRDVLYENLTMKNHTRWLSRKSVVDCTFRNITMVSTKFTELAFDPIGSKNNTFEGIKLVCTGASKATSTAIADSMHTAKTYRGLEQLMIGGGTATNVELEGFAFGISASEPNVYYRNITLKNCGWTTSLSGNNAVILTTNSSNSEISNVTIANTNTALDWAGTVTSALNISPNADVKNLVINNISNNGTAAACLPTESIRLLAKLHDSSLTDIDLKGVTTSLVIFRPEDSLELRNVRYIKTNGVTASRPEKVPKGFVFFDTTLGKPVYYTGTAWVDSAGVAA